jgi:hypothetical protein
MLIALVVSASVGVRVRAAGIVFSQGPDLGLRSVGWQEIPLSATGATAPYTWSVVSGSLPPGFSIRADVPASFPRTRTRGSSAATAQGHFFTLHVTAITI